MRTTGTQSRTDLVVNNPPPDGHGAGRRQLASALLAHEHWQAEAQAHLLLSRGLGLPELFDEVLRPLLEHHDEQVRVGHAGLADVRALRHAVGRLVGRLPRSTVAPTRGTATLAQLARVDHLLSGSMLASALEHQGYAVFVLGELPLLQVAPFLRAQADGSKVLVLVLDEPPADTLRLRGELRRLRTEAPGTRVVLAGRVCRTAPNLAAAIGADGAAADVASGVRLVDTLLQPLTAREIETLQLVAVGRTNRQIATQLGIAPSTVKSSLDRVFDKLSTPDRASAAAVAVRQGWID